MKENVWLKISLLSVSLFIMSHLAIAPAIPKLYAFYQVKGAGVSLASVETLVTIPAMMIMVTVVLGNVIVTRIGKKKTVEIGLLLILLSGIVSFLASEFKLVLLGRLLLGVGIGLYNPLSITMISDYFQGSQRASLIGLRTATMNVGKTLTTLIVGYAMLMGTSYIYLVYFLVIPVFLLFRHFVEEVPLTEQKLSKLVIFDRRVILWMLITFFIGVAYIGATIKIPTLLVTHYGYDELISSYILTLLAFSGILAGLSFGFLAKKMAEQTLNVMLAMMLVGNLFFTVSNHMIFFYVGSVLIGFSFVGGMSAIFDAIAKSYPIEQINFVTSMAITAGNVGAIMAPILLTKMVLFLSLESYLTPFYITAVMMAIGLLCYKTVKRK
ncbi:MFS transporter [Streptococcus sp. S784/96/1]|uniref:MFS transporter n=1 Tax=Streptococcus sp. S784/96/1 TaxID=2653499 RepID=UPI001387016A|nr:MFS transporter [Streptococcus sp. S784/96/1]